MPVFNNALAGAAGSGGAAAYEIERSLRFEPGDSAYLNRTASAGSNTTWTLSTWVKKTGNDNHIFGAGAGNNPGRFGFGFDGSDKINVFVVDAGSTVYLQNSDAVFRDPSAWYHIVVVADTTNSTAADRLIIYVNGVRQTLSGGTMPPNQNTFVNTAAAHAIGRRSYTASDYFDGYLAEMHFVDGQALDETSFGEFDANTGVWNPIKFTGSHGTNGFHLDFSDTSSTTSGSNAGIGKDVSGNGNYWDTNSITTPGTGTAYRTLEISENNTPSVVQRLSNAWDATYIATYVNTSTWAITNTAWLGTDGFGNNELRWIPAGGYAVSSSLRVYFGVYSNVSRSTTLTVTYTDGTTESSSQFTSSIDNWMTLFTASNAANKTIQKVELSNPDSTNLQFGGFVIDDQIVTSLNTDTDSFIDSPTNYEADSGNNGGNYATWNPLTQKGVVTCSNGNLTADTITNGNGWVVSSIPVSSGKYYCEISFGDIEASHNTNFKYIGIVPTSSQAVYTGLDIFRAEGALSIDSNGTSLIRGTIGTGSGETTTTYQSNYGFDENDVIGIAIDCDTPQVTFYKNGVSIGTFPHAMQSGESWVVFMNDWASGYTDIEEYFFNAGQRAFAFAPPTGFKSMCTANLPDSTIANGSDYFDVKTYTGTGGLEVASTSLDTSTAYRYHRILCEGDNNGGSISEIQFFDASGLIDASDPNNAGGSISSNNNQTGSGNGADAWTAFDGVLGGAGYADGVRKDPSYGFYIAKDWGSGVTKTITAVKIWGVDNYAIAGNTASTYVKLQGSNDGSTWTDLQTWNDSRTGSWTTSSSTVVAHTSDTATKISGYEFSPDLAWFKSRNGSDWHALVDTVRGKTKVLFSNATNAEETRTEGVSSFNSDGFSLGDYAPMNKYNDSLVAWAWDAGDSTGSNTDGDITSSVRANTSAGFSIVKWTTPTWAGSSGRQVGHGLGAAPAFIITKGLTTTGGWYTYHKDLDATNPNDYYLTLNTPDARNSLADSFGPNIPNSTTFGDRLLGFTEGEDSVAFCFAPVEGYSAFGKYSGNSLPTEGNFVYLPFRPAFLLIKDITSNGYWYLTDSGRNPTNDGTTNYVWANTNGSEQSDYVVDLLSNGFRLLASSGNLNASGRDYIYAAFAENPFKTARAR